MATVNKNFVVKNGLVIQGSTATVNGNNILTESAADSYILNLVGGSTLVKSVDSIFSVDSNGNLTLGLGSGITTDMMSNHIVIDRQTVDTWYDAAGAAATAEQNAKDYSDSQLPGYAYPLELNTLSNAVNLRADGTTLEFVADSMEPSKTNLKVKISTSGGIKSDLMNGLGLDYSTVEGQLVTDGFAKTSDITNALSTFGSQTSTDIQDAITTAENYADSLASNYDAAGSAASALTSANQYTDTAVGNVVGLAPDALNTLQELAAAFNNSPDTLQNLITTVGGKQDALTPGNGITISGNTISTAPSNGLSHSIDGKIQIERPTVDTWYDAAGAAATAQSNAESYADNVSSQAQSAAQSYADGLASNYDAAGAAATAETAANTYTDNSISNGNSNAEPVYKGIKIGYYTELVSGWQSTSNGSAFSPLSWNTSTWGTAKLTVHVRSGVHTQASEILVARDSSNNLHVTEYAIVSTNGSLAEVSVAINGNNTELVVTPTAGHDLTEAVASGSVIAWAD